MRTNTEDMEVHGGWEGGARRPAIEMAPGWPLAAKANWRLTSRRESLQSQRPPALRRAWAPMRSEEHLRGLEERPAQRLDAQFEAIQAARHPFEEAPLPDRGLLDASLSAQQRAVPAGERRGGSRGSRREGLVAPVAQHYPQVVSGIGEKPDRVYEDESRFRPHPWREHPQRVPRMGIAVDHDTALQVKRGRAPLGIPQGFAHDPLRTRMAQVLPYAADHTGELPGLLVVRRHHQTRRARRLPRLAQHLA